MIVHVPLLYMHATEITNLYVNEYNYIQYTLQLEQVCTKNCMFIHIMSAHGCKLLHLQNSKKQKL